MSGLWNLWEVKPPPTCRVKSLFHSREISNMKTVLFDMLKTLRGGHHLNKEAALLSRALYRCKRLFHHDKGMQNLVKIYQCLKKYLRLNLFESVRIFKWNLPGNLPQGTSHAYLPTRQMLMWILLRLQAYAQIFVRIMQLARIGGQQLHGKLCLGWGLKMTLFTYGLTARLLTISKFLVAKSIEWYNLLHKYLPCFESTAEFLPGHKFPANLKDWIGDVDLSSPVRKTSIDKVLEIITISDDDEDGEDEVLITDDFSNSKEFKIDDDSEASVEAEQELIMTNSRDQIKEKAKSPDLGIPISRTSKKDSQK